MAYTGHILLTIDVEEWFHVENFKPFIPFSTWSSRETRVEKNTHLFLDLLDATNVNESGSNEDFHPKATFFVLGWVAKRMPHLIREIHRRGHEVASHGVRHELCNHCSLEELKIDLTESKSLLEDILGVQIYGYRAPSFSINPEVLDIIGETGYLYDSSYNSFSLNGHYGHIDVVKNETGIAHSVSNSLYELPISNLELASSSFPVGGGAYFRIIPLALFTQAVKYILKKQKAYLFYIHPWEIDPKQPRIREASFFLKFRHYYNLTGSLSKLIQLIHTFNRCKFITCFDYLHQMHLH